MVHRRDVVHDVAHIPVTPLGAREAGCIYEKAVGQRPDRCRGVLVRAKRPDLLRLRAREHHLGLPRRQADSCPYRGHETTDRLSECRRRLQPPDPSRLPQRPDRRVLRPGQRCLLSPDRRRRQLVHGGQPSSGSTAGGSSVATHQALSRNSVARGAGDRSTFRLPGQPPKKGDLSYCPVGNRPTRRSRRFGRWLLVAGWERS
jgi:hypothetical protein